MKRLTRKQAVLQVLIDAQRGKRFHFHGMPVPAGWAPLKELCNERTGGSEGTRRIREMRKAGLNIIHRDFYVPIYEYGKERKDYTTIYFLKTPERYINFEKGTPIIPGIDVHPNGQLKFA